MYYLLHPTAVPLIQFSLLVMLSPLELRRVPRLAAIIPSPCLLLIAAHAGPQGDVYARRCIEPKTLGHFDEIEFIDVENRSERMRGVSLEVRFITFFRRLQRKLAT